MAVWSEVNLSELELTRFDAEYYKPEYLIAKSMVGERKLKTYGILVLHPAEFLRRYTETGLFILLAQNNRGNYYDWSVKHYAPKNLESTVLRNCLIFGDVTITRSGANFGQTSVIGIELENQNIYACADLLVLRSPSIDGHLISTYLNTYIGKLLLDRGAYGAAQPHIAPTYIKEIPFPELLIQHEIEISELVKKSKQLSQQAANIFAQTQQLLESELGLDKLSFQKPMGYTAQFSELELSRRLDAQHYQAKFTQLLAHLAKFPNRKIRDIQTCNRRGIQPIYVNDGNFDVINSQHLGPKHINYDGLEKTSHRYFSASPVAHIRKNDLLIYTTGAYIGRTNVYLSDAPAFASNHVNILCITPDIDAAYMAMVFQSVVGQFQTQKHSRGSAQAELYPNDIDKFVVPILPFEQQKTIGDLVRESLVKQRESERLLEQAKTRVEQLIEAAVQS